jgi:tripartite-type tricarboxylate transporter receptor subunit TctC
MKFLTALYALSCLALAGGARADEAADFYRGKQVQLVVGYGAGGGYDLYARLLARHFGDFIPGSPTVVVQNMPGAGSLRAAQFIQSVAARDGTIVGALDRQAPVAAVLGGNPAIKYRASDMVFLGTLSSYADDAFVLWARRDAGAKSLADLMRPDGPELKVGGSASGSTDDATVLLLRDVTGMRLKLITGYPDGNSIALALERAELEGRTSVVSSITATHPDWMRADGPVHPIVQVGRKTRLPALAHVPTARELARDDLGLAIIEAMEAPYQFARPFILPPGLPPERQAALRKAFMAAANSPGLRAEATRMSIDVSPLDGETVGQLVVAMEQARPEVLSYIRKILGVEAP